MKLALLAICAVAAVAGFVALPLLVYGAPLAFDLHVSQKIFYYHVPAAFVMFVSIFVCGIASVGFLKSRNARWDDVAAAAGDLAVVFGAIVLTSGPIWARVAWGVWWTWDARLTQSLLLFMIFVAYALLRRYGGIGSERLAAGLAIFGMVDVPLVYFAVNFWKTQHPSNSVVPSLDGEMRTAFLVGTLSYFALFGLLLAARIAVGRGQRRLNEIEDLAVESGRLE